MIGSAADSFLQEAISDLKVAELLRCAHKYSQAIYHFQQAFEKMLKSMYCYLRIKHEQAPESKAYNESVEYSHNTKQSTLDLLGKLCELDERVTTSHSGESADALKHKMTSYRATVEKLKSQKGYRYYLLSKELSYIRK